MDPQMLRCLMARLDSLEKVVLSSQPGSGATLLPQPPPAPWPVKDEDLDDAFSGDSLLQDFGVEIDDTQLNNLADAMDLVTATPPAPEAIPITSQNKVSDQACRAPFPCATDFPVDGLSFWNLHSMLFFWRSSHQSRANRTKVTTTMPSFGQTWV